MRTIVNRWNSIYQRPLDEFQSLQVLDTYNKTRYSRRKHKEGLLELASREAYERRDVHFATILEDDDTPYCSIAANAGFWGVDFLRDNFDNYLIYDYRDSYSADGRLFLRTIMLSECHPGTAQKRRRIDFVFSPDGSVHRLRYSDDEGNPASIVDQLPILSPSELSLLWVDYPAFKEYSELIRLDRIPMLARDRIFEYTDKEFPAFRAHLQRDIDEYQGKV